MEQLNKAIQVEEYNMYPTNILPYSRSLSNEVKVDKQQVYHDCCYYLIVRPQPREPTTAKRKENTHDFEAKGIVQFQVFVPQPFSFLLI